MAPQFAGLQDTRVNRSIIEIGPETFCSIAYSRA
jgi:hypothetical protein